MDYSSAALQLRHKGHGHELPKRKIQHNTYLTRLTQDEIALLFHWTYIAIFQSDGSVVLDTGGWTTVTTKDRFDWVSGWTVFSARHHHRASTAWWLLPRGTQGWKEDLWVPFFDGIHVHQHTGQVLSADEEVLAEMVYRDPGPSRRDQVTEFLTVLTDPTEMASIAQRASAAPMQPLRPRSALSEMLEDHELTLSSIYHALRIDAAKRGELDRALEMEALDWVERMQRGEEPPRLRSTIRSFVSYLATA